MTTLGKISHLTMVKIQNILDMVGRSNENGFLNFLKQTLENLTIVTAYIAGQLVEGI